MPNASRPGALSLRVDVAGQYLQADAPLLDRADQLDDLCERMAYPIEYPNDERVAFTQRIQGAGKDLRPVNLRLLSAKSTNHGDGLIGCRAERLVMSGPARERKVGL